MLTVLALLSAGSAPAGCFNGGAFVGAQAGFARLILKKEAAAKPITQAIADKAFDTVVAALSNPASYTMYDAVADKAAVDALKDFDAGVATLKVPVAGATPASINAAFVAFVRQIPSAQDLTSVKIALIGDAQAKANFANTLAAMVTAVGVEVAKIKKADVVAGLVAADAETKYTSNNGFAGIHAGYLGRVNDKCLVGGLVEGNWVFGKGLTPDGGVEDKDTFARFNAGVFLRAMFNLTHNFMAGADLGFAMQEFRQFKQDASGANTKDKESKFFWNPAARVVLGFALTDNILATAHFGGVFPMLKQDSLRSTAVKTKYSNWNGGVGIAYAFGA